MALHGADVYAGWMGLDGEPWRTHALALGYTGLPQHERKRWDEMAKLLDRPDLRMMFGTSTSERVKALTNRQVAHEQAAKVVERYADKPACTCGCRSIDPIYHKPTCEWKQWMARGWQALNNG